MPSIVDVLLLAFNFNFNCNTLHMHLFLVGDVASSLDYFSRHKVYVVLPPVPGVITNALKHNYRTDGRSEGSGTHWKLGWL